MLDFSHLSLNTYITKGNIATFYLQFRNTVDFKWTPELQQNLDRVKKELTDGKLRFVIPN